MKNTVSTIQKQKEQNDKITMLTCYDYSTAKLMDEAGINTILVGDSLGMTVLGYEDTLSVTMEDMIHHCAAVTRGGYRGYAFYVLSGIYRSSCNERRAPDEGRSRSDG